MTIWFKKEKGTFPSFPNFRFCAITKIENSEISESFFFALNVNTSRES